MRETTEELVRECVWKIRAITRTGPFFSDAHSVLMYKSNVLGYIEYRTAAVYHATAEVLGPVDRLQRKFLNELSISDEEALLHFNLAPLETRRDIAMLGLIHRASLGAGPQQLQNAHQWW